MPEPQWLALIYGGSEIMLSLLRRSSGSTQTRDDRGSLRMIWVVILASLLCAGLLARFLPQAQLPSSPAIYATGLVLFVAGLALRWYSIVYLGKYFTVDVAVAADHVVIDTGPYRFIRHPSYSGALLAFLGLAICFGNWASLIVLMSAISWVFLRRIRIEEQVLVSQLGEPYAGYMRRTRRLIPFVY